MVKSQPSLQSSVSFEGTAVAGPDLLRSPVSGQTCVHWRLRIVERLTSRTQLVHELASSEPFDLDWSTSPARGDAGRAPVRIRLEPEAARILATPVLHREGTPGAAAAARAFGFAGPISVEEVVIRHGEQLFAEGILDDPGRADGPFRSTSRGLALPRRAPRRRAHARATPARAAAAPRASRGAAPAPALSAPLRTCGVRRRLQGLVGA